MISQSHVYREITIFSRDDTYQWNRTSSDPVRLVSNSFKTRDNRQNTCVHVKTCIGEPYQLWTSMTRANWFRNGSLFAGKCRSLLQIWIQLLHNIKHNILATVPCNVKLMCLSSSRVRCHCGWLVITSVPTLFYPWHIHFKNPLLTSANEITQWILYMVQPRLGDHNIYNFIIIINAMFRMWTGHYIWIPTSHVAFYCLACENDVNY